MANPKITGRIEVIVNGVTLLNKSGATATGIGISGEPARERKPVLGDTGLHGYVEESIEASCEVTVTDRDDIKIDTVARINGDGTVIFRAAGGSGKAYIMENATAMNNFSLTGGQGEIKLKFGGAGWTETTY